MKLSPVWDSDPARREALRDLLNLEDGLTPWEADFLDSLSKLTRPPTPRQIDVLDQIRMRKGY